MRHIPCPKRDGTGEFGNRPVLPRRVSVMTQPPVRLEVPDDLVVRAANAFTVWAITDDYHWDDFDALFSRDATGTDRKRGIRGVG